MKLPFSYRDALELLSPRTLERLFTFNAVRRAIERVEAGGFKVSKPERAALDDATRLLKLALGCDVDRLSADPRNPPAPLLSHEFERLFLTQDRN